MLDHCLPLICVQAGSAKYKRVLYWYCKPATNLLQENKFIFGIFLIVKKLVPQVMRRLCMTMGRGARKGRRGGCVCLFRQRGLKQ